MLFVSITNVMVFIRRRHSHTLIVTSTGQLFAMGSGEGGQLGLGDIVDRHSPTLVAALGNVC